MVYPPEDGHPSHYVTPPSKSKQREKHTNKHTKTKSKRTCQFDCVSISSLYFTYSILCSTVYQYTVQYYSACSSGHLLSASIESHHSSDAVCWRENVLID